MNLLLQQLEAFSCFPSLKVSPERRPAIVGNIVRDVLHPYVSKLAQDIQAESDDRHRQTHFQSVAGYCLHNYVHSPEPQLSLDFIKGLHRQLFSSVSRVPLTTDDGSEAFMTPGELKTLPSRS